MQDERGDSDLQRQIDDLTGRTTANEASIDALGVRADAARGRADYIEARADINREMIAELQAEGVLSQEHAVHMQEALVSSRTIGAAIGILMASRQVPQDQAFSMLKEASQRSNRKIRDLAGELVESASSEARSPALKKV